MTSAPGRAAPEADDAFTTDIAEVTSRAGRTGRWIMWTTGRWMAFDLKVEAGATLQVTYWGQDASKNFDIELDGQILTHETLAGPPEDGFRRMDYVLPAGVSGKFHLRFVTRNSELAVFECRTLRPAGAVA